MTGTPPVGLSHCTSHKMDGRHPSDTFPIDLDTHRYPSIPTATSITYPLPGSVTNSPSATYTPTLDLLLVFPAIRDAPFLFLPSPSPPLSQASTPLQSVIKYHLDRGDFSRLGHHYRLFFFFRSPHHRIPRWAHDALF